MKEAAKHVTYSLFSGVLNALQYLTAIKTENIPFFSKKKETWTQNFIPSVCVVMAKQYYITSYMIGTYLVLENGENISSMYKEPESLKYIDRIREQNSNFRQLYTFLVIGSVFLTFINLATCVQHIYDKYLQPVKSLKQN